MHDIDFLPNTYRQKHLRKQWEPWRVAVVAAFVALMGTIVLFDYQRYHAAQRQLDAILPQHEAALAQTKQLALLQAECRSLRAEANLYTYLRHPWPRTRILAALVEDLPDPIVLEELRITKQIPMEQTRTPQYSKEEREEEAKRRDKLPPAARDYEKLRDKNDKARTVVTLAGVTEDSAALYHYLSKLDQADLFEKVDLDSLERETEDRSRAMRFRVTVMVRPGYGQQGGPTKPDTKTVAQSKSTTS